ncbi:ionotropic receptor 21a-like [Macrobrachium nipponense]|uniref:ionotropic receptor 21a-like n=1 Tax=Macrobrachium nipponense TaxID=159736 RepID=UPI0030C8B841
MSPVIKLGTATAKQESILDPAEARKQVGFYKTAAERQDSILDPVEARKQHIDFQDSYENLQPWAALAIVLLASSNSLITANINSDRALKGTLHQLPFLEAKETSGNATESDEAPGNFAQAVSTLLIELRTSLQQCSLSVATDFYFYHAVDVFLSHKLDGTTQADAGKSSSVPVSLFLLPSSKDSINEVLFSIKDYYRRVNKETCTNYIFLQRDAKQLLHLLEALYTERLNLLARFVLITDVRGADVIKLLSASPVSKIVNILLATPADVTKGALKLKTHDFFQNNQRISERTLGTWRADQTSRMTAVRKFDWFSPKLDNFNGFEFRVTTFNHPPSSIFEVNDDGSISYDGLEIRLLKTMVSKLNFTVKIAQPRDGDKWGSKLENNTWTGAMGETIRGETEVSFANYFITSDRLKLIDMTRPYHIDYTCFITPMPQPSPQYSAVAWPFQLNVWIAVFLTLFLIPPVIRLTAILEVGTWFKDFGNAFMFTLGTFLNKSPPPELMPLSNGLRIAVITSSLATLVLGVAYTSSLIAFLLVPLPTQPVNTLEDLLDSDLQWGVRDTGGWEEWFSNSIDPTSRKIAEGFKFVRGIEAGIARVLEGNFAFMNSGTFLRYLVSSNFTNEYGQTELHVTRECFVPFRVGLGMPRFSVYTSKFNAVIDRVVEGGMVSRWFQDLLHKAERKQRDKTRKMQKLSENRDPTSSVGKKLSLYHLQGTFIILCAGWVLAFVAFICEVLFGSRCDLKFDSKGLKHEGN